MGTRADFYVGVGPNAEWLGSVAFDGYEWTEERENPVKKAKTGRQFKKAVDDILANRDDATKPEMGWPWPWENSCLTDYVYYFHHGKVSWKNRSDWPDMTKKQNVTFGKRSGLIVVAGR